MEHSFAAHHALLARSAYLAVRPISPQHGQKKRKTKIQDKERKLAETGIQNTFSSYVAQARG